jgi:hypothetical protein
VVKVEEKKNKKSSCFSVQIFLSSQEKKAQFICGPCRFPFRGPCRGKGIYSPQIANPQIATFAEGPKI